MDHTMLLQALVLEVQQLKELVQSRIDERRLYSIPEICERTGLSDSSIRRGIAEGKYSVCKHGRVLRLELGQVFEAMRQEGGG